MSAKPREQRRVVFLKARMRDEEGWCDITIHNVSSRGLMARSPRSLQRGEYVEIRKGIVAIVGRVVWSKNGTFGVRSQDRIDIAGLLGEVGTSTPAADGDRRAASRGGAPIPAPAAAAAIAARAEQGRLWGRAFQWVALTACVAGAGALLAHMAHSAISAPMRRVGSILAPPLPPDP